MQHRIVLIRGDGIGPEISDAVRRVIEAAGVEVDWVNAEAGLIAIDREGQALPPETLDKLRDVKVALKGPTTTPVGAGHRSVNVQIRKALNLYANVRMARTLPGVETRFDGVDIVVVRENVEDTYGGIEYMQSPDVAQCLKFITRPGTAAVVRYAFEYAQQMGRDKVTCIHKGNIHKKTDGLFLEVFREISDEYRHIEANDLIVDNACMQLVTRPEQFDVMVMPNLFGDIISDLCAGLIGGLGVAPGSNIGDDIAIFEAVHGSAPDIAGKGLANPTALLQSAIHMLRYLGERRAAANIEAALHSCLEDGEKTRDLGGSLNTEQFTKAVIDRTSRVPKEREIRPMRVRNPGATTRARVEEVLVGVDVYVRSTEPPAFPEQIGPLENRGLAIRGTNYDADDDPPPPISDWWRVRYLSESAVEDSDLHTVLQEISTVAPWVHVEKLFLHNGVASFTG